MPLPRELGLGLNLRFVYPGICISSWPTEQRNASVLAKTSPSLTWKQATAVSRRGGKSGAARFPALIVRGNGARARTRALIPREIMECRLPG